VLIIGCGFLAVGLIDAAHLMSYRGMPDFVTPAHPEKAINFWLAARYVAAATLVAVAWRDWPPIPGRGPRSAMLAAALAVPAAVVGLQLYAPSIWPRTFVDGQGLTAFKVGAEYGLVALMSLAAWGFQRRVAYERRFDALDLRTAAVITVLGELCFTLYSNVNDVFQLLGHAYKIVAYLYIYRAVFVVGVRQPYERLQQEIVRAFEGETYRQQRQKIIARNFANQFMVPLYLEVYKLVIENEDQQKVIEVMADVCAFWKRKRRVGGCRQTNLATESFLLAERT